MKPKKTEILGSLQSKIMEIIWKAGKPLKPAEVLEMLGDDHAYTTIMTVLKRMVDKKILMRKLSGKVYYYRPCDCKEKFVESNLKSIYNELMQSYGKMAIANFVDVVRANKEDVKLLEEYLETSK